jgi:hypothetical protein
MLESTPAPMIEASASGDAATRINRHLRAKSIYALIFALYFGDSAVAESLKEFTGVWANSAAACKAHHSGRIQSKSQVTVSGFDLIGICKDAIDYLYQPASCGVSEIIKRSNLVEFSAACEEKGQPLDPVTVTMKVRSQNEILFGDNESFMSGRYLRCSKVYQCDRANDRYWSPKGSR